MTRRSFLAAVLAAVSLAGCAGAPSWKAPVDLEVLTYRTQAPFMCSSCEGLEFALAADGRMWVLRTGRATKTRDWRKRNFVQVAPERAAEVWALLEPYRPSADAPALGPACEEQIPDQGGVNVSWRTGGVEKTIMYSGCDPKVHGELRERLNAVPGMLGLRGGPFA